MVDSVISSRFLNPSPDMKLNKMREVSQKLEANFLAEMLKNAKFGEPSEEFGGGIGEEQFASFLRQAEADKMAQKGGIGLAEAIFQSLVKRTGALSGDA